MYLLLFIYVYFYIYIDFYNKKKIYIENMGQETFMTEKSKDKKKTKNKSNDLDKHIDRKRLPTD